MKKLILTAVMLGSLAWVAQGAEPSARIAKVWTEKENVVVQVETTGRVLKVTLESSSRVGRRSWEPRAVHYLTNSEPEGVQFTMRAPMSSGMEILRVRSDLVDGSLPASFYTGTNEFVSGAQAGGGMRTGAVEGTAPTADVAGNGDSSVARDVVESDIWKLDGDRLFFFNQYRGLQVIDVSNPDSPTVSGTYDVAAAGEQMYLIDHTKIVLLARDNCYWWGSGAESRVVLLELVNGVPTLVKELPVSGQIAESRLVGTALYVVANSYEPRIVASPKGDTEQWEWGSTVNSFDLSNFATAEQKSKDWVRGYGNVIYANDRNLFVAQNDYSTSAPTSVVNIFDISAPNGVFTKISTIKAAGIIGDKFKMNQVGDTFFAVMQETATPRGTFVSSFSLADPKNPVQLAHLRLIDNERPFATRFNGNILYVVTFFVVDPLWVVDLSDPAAPKKVGELEIPGWSTYLQPMGDNLLAIGLDRSTNGFQRTAVQLFNVADPAKPSLLSKVIIGDQYSGSEANWDEKAFGVLPEHNLLLVPFHSYSTNGYFEGVQLIDLKANELVKRGVIMQNMGARRATVHKDRILSLSSRELLTVDATDRDQPKITTKTELSWSADQVHLSGDHLIEVDAYQSAGPALRVVLANNTSKVLQTVALTNLPYLGSGIVNGKLHVLQGRSADITYVPVQDEKSNIVYKATATNPAVFIISTFSLAQLPALPLVSVASKESAREQYLYGRYEALQPKAGLIVWNNGNSGGAPWWWYRGGGIAVDLAPVRGGFAADIAYPFWYGGNSGHMIAFDPARNAILSEVQLSGTNGWWSFSKGFGTNGLVYTSHSVSEFDLSIDPPPYTWEYYDGTKTVTMTNDPPPGVWVQRFYLDVVDFNEPAEPIARKPANIPGSLIGIDRGGEILFGRAYDLRLSESIVAATYDGVQAHQIDSFPFGMTWPRPAISKGAYVYAGIAGTNNVGGQIETWTLNNAGKFERVSGIDVKDPAQDFALFGDLLVAQAGKLLLFDTRTPARPAPIGSGQANACYGAQLSSADGAVDRGLWLPMGWYGVVHIPVMPPVETTQ